MFAVLAAHSTWLDLYEPDRAYRFRGGYLQLETIGSQPVFQTPSKAVREMHTMLYPFNLPWFFRAGKRAGTWRTLSSNLTSLFSSIFTVNLSSASTRKCS